MKNNKGFTLVELLAVVAILILIITIITPKIFKQFKTAEDVTDNEQMKTIIDTAKLYMNQHSNLLPEANDFYVLQLQELKNSGLIKSSQILNPSTKEELTGCIIIKYQNKKYNYEYNEDNCNKAVTLTFNPEGGQVNQTTKNIISGEPYGALPIPTKTGYTFVGWSTSQTDTNIVYDNTEYTGTLASDSTSEYKNIKSYGIVAPFSENDVYQLDVDIKGEGSLTTFFYGQSGYLQVKRVESSDGTINTSGDGNNYIKLTDEYRHYTARYTLGSSGDGSVNKILLFRVYPGSTAYIKNIKFTKVSTSSIIYTEPTVSDNYVYDKLGVGDNRELISDARETGNKDIKTYTVRGPFAENEVYQLDADVKGSGTITTFFHGSTNYLQVKKVETSQGVTNTYTDGHHDITLTNEYQHYTAKFTLGNTGYGNVNKYLYFRTTAGSLAYIKNITLKKVYPIEEQVVPANTNLYAIWRANS